VSNSHPPEEIAKIHASHDRRVDEGWMDSITCDRCCRILIMGDGRRTVASAKPCRGGR
jgi:hypothetical protein